MAEAKQKKDPFKTRKTRTVAAKDSDTVTPPEEIAEAIDRFRGCQDQAKHFEGEATVYKDSIQNWAQAEFVKRVQSGIGGSFKIMGDETMATYVVMDSSAGLTDEDVAQIEERWGSDAAEALITRDFRSIRFDAKVLEANYDAVVEALSVLPDHVLENLFKPMFMKAKPGAVDKAQTFAKTEEELRELVEALKMKNYIR